MGLFHCPVGAAYYDDDDCIDCGLCYARTDEERVEASKKIREYIRSCAPASPRIGKIAICGKGGSGKTTITTLLASALKDTGYRVTILDADESNPGLGRLLGMKKEPAPLRELFREDPSPADAIEQKLLERDQFAVTDMPSRFVADHGGLKFMLAGKITDPFQGCACSLAECARRVVEKLRVGDGEMLLIDMEAGVESFGRGVERHADTVLAVVEPSYESIVLAERIAFMAQGMGITRIGAVLNKIPAQNTADRITGELDKRGVKIFGIVHYDQVLAEAGLEGKPLPCTAAFDEVKEIVRSLIIRG